VLTKAIKYHPVEELLVTSVILIFVKEIYYLSENNN